MRNSEGYLDPTASMAINKVMKEENRMEIKRGDVYMIEDRRTGDYNPSVVVSADGRSDIKCQVVNIKDIAATKDTHVPVIVKKPMTACCEGVFTIQTYLLCEFVKVLNEDEMNAIDAALIRQLGIDPFSHTEDTEALEEARKTNKVMKEMLEDANRQIDELTKELEEEREKAKKTEKFEEYAGIERDVYKRLYDDLLGKVMAHEC